MDRPQKKVKYNDQGGREFKNLRDHNEDGSSNNDDQEEAVLQKFEVEDLHKLIKNYEKHILKNQELRSKYPKNPEKWMDSEVDLVEDISKFNILTTETQLWGDFIQSGIIPKFITLLSHENTDLSLEVISFVRDLCDTEIEQDSVKIVLELYDTFIKNKLLEGLVQNLFRLDAEKEDDSEGVEKILNVIENILEIKPDTAEYVADNTKIFTWIIKKLSPKTPFDDIKLYASEIFSILVQNSKPNQFTLGKIGAIEHILVIIADYRKKDPSNEEEREMLENLFDVLCSALLVPDNQLLFTKNEGVELMIRVVKEKNFCSRLAIKTLSYAMEKNFVNCKVFIDGLGLKFLFPILMGKGIKEKKPDLQTQLNEYLISILNSLVVHMTGVYLDRVINKFKEEDSEKVDRLIELYNQYLKKYKAVVEKIQDEDDEGSDEALIEKYGVLYVLQKVAFLLGTLYITPDEHLNKVLKRRLDLHDIKPEHFGELLNEYANEIEDTKENEQQRNVLHELATKLLNQTQQNGGAK